MVIGGDLCLLAPTSGRAFLTGIGAFLLAHVAYFDGFWTMGIAPLGFGLALVGLAPLSGHSIAGRAPDVPERLQRPVVAYILVITGMVAGAVGVWMHTPAAASLVPTAGLFLVSDVGVAMQRFKSRRLSHQALGPARLLHRTARVRLAHRMARVMR